MTALLHDPSSSGSPRHDAFQTTLWSRVRLAQEDGPSTASALEGLCGVYWPPVYAFLRRSGHSPEEAKDFTQGFFQYILETDLLKKADPQRGRFRSFLLGCLKFFVSNQQTRARAAKRGGHSITLPIHEDADEFAVPVETQTPERAFERKWALAVLDEAMRRLAAEYERAGLNDQFSLLQPFLSGEADEAFASLAARLGKSEGAARVLVCRLRNRFRRVVRAVIADTVADPEQVESELRYLEAALRDE